MKLIPVIFYLGIILPVDCALEGCTDEHHVSNTTVILAPYKKVNLDPSIGFIQLKILKIYPAQLDCTAGERYANLYICKRLLNADTIYIFEECEKVPQFAFDSSANHIPIIDPNAILVHYPEKVNIFVPANFKIPNNAKYLFAKLSDISES
jgi:hypothetical protein